LIRPVHIGWNSVVKPYDFDRIDLQIRPSASRYEGGAANMAGQIGLAASLNLLRELGVSSAASPVAECVLDIARHACSELLKIGATILSPQAAGHESGIVTFALPGLEPMSLREKLMAAGVIVSCRGGGLRISAHGYNNQEDVTRLIEVVQRVATER
jgi:cysteine desulfurase / selenocysteine lyase